MCEPEVNGDNILFVWAVTLGGQLTCCCSVGVGRLMFFNSISTIL